MKFYTIALLIATASAQRSVLLTEKTALLDEIQSHSATLQAEEARLAEIEK